MLKYIYFMFLLSFYCAICELPAAIFTSELWTASGESDQDTGRRSASCSHYRKYSGVSKDAAWRERAGGRIHDILSTEVNVPHNFLHAHMCSQTSVRLCTSELAG